MQNCSSVQANTPVTGDMLNQPTIQQMMSQGEGCSLCALTDGFRVLHFFGACCQEPEASGELQISVSVCSKPMWCHTVNGLDRTGGNHVSLNFKTLYRPRHHSSIITNKHQINLLPFLQKRNKEIGNMSINKTLVGASHLSFCDFYTT